MLIQSKADIEKACIEIQAYLEEYCSEDATEIVERGSTLSVYMAQSGKLLADAKYHLNKKTKESILAKLDTGLPASTLNELIKSDCEEENHLVNWCERINRGCTHQMDWCRSMLSKAKEEMRFQNFSS